MKEKIETKNLEEAILTLKEAYELFLQNDEEKLKSALQDSCIKRFEYTYETAKKMMNRYLKYEFDKTDLPINNVFREIYGLGIINDFERWVNYRTMRNNTSHEYNRNEANIIIEILPEFISDVEYFFINLQKSLNYWGSMKGLTSKQEKMVLDIINKYDSYKFYAYGSRVKGNFVKSSDLDLLVKGDKLLPMQVIEKIKNDFYQSLLPFIVNITDYYDIKSDFYKLIEQDLFPLN